METKQMAATVSSLVHHWFVDRGINVRYRPGVASALSPIGAPHSDLDSRLSWLLAQVRPVVSRCLEHVDRETLGEILGLADNELLPVVTPIVTHGADG